MMKGPSVAIGIHRGGKGRRPTGPDIAGLQGREGGDIPEIRHLRERRVDAGI